jgi:hypothetical protein
MLLLLLAGILFGVLYGEIIWNVYNSGRRSFEYIKSSAKFMSILNYILAIMFHSAGSLVFAATISLYYYIIYDYRKPNKT